MKIYINLLKFFIIFLLLPILFTTSCDILNTYSEDDYLALGEKDKEYNGSNSIEIALEDYNYTINNGGTFSFDNIPAIQRTSQIIFKIYNNGSKPLELTGDPKIEINSIVDFTLDQNITNTTIHPDSWALFIITYTSTATDGQVKTSTISIPNNSEDNNPFIFTISCTAKGLNIIEFKNTGSTDWIFPAHSTTGNVLLVGGGGGGGGSYYHFGNDVGSGAGGGAGEVIQTTLTLEYNQLYTIIIGNGGTGGANDNDPIYEGEGGNGSASQIILNSNIILSADYGRGGEGGLSGGIAQGGFGFPIPSGLGQAGDSPGNLSDGGDGGYNNFGGSESRGIGGDYHHSGGYPGSPGDSNTGAGGGGGGACENGTFLGGEGGAGGSGYCRIQYIGFSIP